MKEEPENNITICKNCFKINYNNCDFCKVCFFIWYKQGGRLRYRKTEEEEKCLISYCEKD